jgi:hypothetical protein
MTASDPFDSSPAALEQGDLDESYAAIKAELNPENIREGKRSPYHYPLWSIASAGFLIAVVGCFVLAAQVAKIDTSIASMTTARDCNQIQASGLAPFFTHAQLLFNLNWTDYYDAKGSYFEETFILDIKTPPALS